MLVHLGNYNQMLDESRVVKCVWTNSAILIQILTSRSIVGN